MHTIYRCANRSCNCDYISKIILLEYTNLGMSNVGYMVVKVRGNEQ